MCVCVYSFSDFFFWLHHVACGILVPQPETEPMSPAVEVRSPQHWTTREVPQILFHYRLHYKFHRILSVVPCAIQ